MRTNIFVFGAILSALLILGSAGALEHDCISFGQAILQSIIGFIGTAYFFRKVNT